MKTIRKRISTILLLYSSLINPAVVIAEKSVYEKSIAGHTAGKTAAGCLRATASSELDLNNVRALIYTGGDMWWDHSSAPKYEVPKGSGKSSLYAGSLWLGGTDANGQLRLAGVRFRQAGDDYWSGPLKTDGSASVDADMCAKYDRHFRITRLEVEEFVALSRNYIPAKRVPLDLIPKSIIEWPGNNGDKGYDYNLAPYRDLNNDGIYDPQDGDFPDYDVDGSRNCSFNTCKLGLYGDQTLWWVFNDNGNIHTETGSNSIGMEIRAQAFAFSTNDEINNMTFYNYQLINRSTFKLKDTYFGQWVDADIGCATDDYVGCDVGRGLGYCYNANQIDCSGSNSYGANPPAIGVDFFEGPYMDPNGKDDPVNVEEGVNGLNFSDAIVDNERWGMRRFVYHDNNGTVVGDPRTSTDYYNYMRGFWRDGTRMVYGGNGYLLNPLADPSIICDFMFPDETDVTNWGTYGKVPANKKWTEQTANNTPYDRRFLQSAGPFTLEPGACNNITVGVVWARATTGDPFASVEAVRKADDKAQALFESCFKIMNGPDAPDLTIRELENELIISLENKPTSNNAGEQYMEEDPVLKKITTDPYYRFQGYQVFQFKDPTVTMADVHDPAKVRLVAQCDVKDGIGQIVNYYKDIRLGAEVPVEEVNGSDKGIVHTLRVTSDLFASGDNKLVNHKPYYFTVVAYAYNNYEKHDPLNGYPYGQAHPYFSGRRNIKTYSGIPHTPVTENGGQKLPASYGTGMMLKRVEGQGNGGNVLDLSSESIAEILTGTDHRSLNPLYEADRGPVNVKVYDPVKVPKGDFEIRFDGTADTSRWVLTNTTTGEKISSERTIKINNEQLIPKWGLSVAVAQVKNAGDEPLNGNGYLEATMEFANPENAWLTGVPDVDVNTPFNWIRSGKATTDPIYADYAGLDDNQVYEKLLGGIIAPYRMASQSAAGPAWKNAIVMGVPSGQASNRLSELPGIDLVFTNDPAKWTRCLVIELSDDKLLSENNAEKMDKRIHISVDKNGNSEGTGTTGIGSGKSWFPGYAINVETGERLNIMFGEDSWLKNHNGHDMKWNPTETMIDEGGGYVFGGKHYVYVMNTKYDECSRYDSLLSSLSVIEKRKVYKEAGWVMMPVAVPGENLLSAEVKIRVRVTKPYAVYSTSASPVNNNNPLYRFSTDGIAAVQNSSKIAKSALDLINVVPNPYYGYSAYEKNQLDNQVKIVNLPAKCTVSIFTVSGILVRKYQRDMAKDESLGTDISNSNYESAQEWDMKNLKGIPISSGLYIIHVNAEGVGEKVIKWFGVLRPTDLDSF